MEYIVYVDLITNGCYLRNIKDSVGRNVQQEVDLVEAKGHQDQKKWKKQTCHY